MIFYATVATVYSLLFIVLSVQIIVGSDSPLKMFPFPPLPVRAWVLGLIPILYLTAGLIIPLAVLAGFLSDTIWWRALAFSVTVIQILAAGGTSLIAGAHLAHQATAQFVPSNDQPTNLAGS